MTAHESGAIHVAPGMEDVARALLATQLSGTPLEWRPGAPPTGIEVFPSEQQDGWGSYQIGLSGWGARSKWYCTMPAPDEERCALMSLSISMYRLPTCTLFLRHGECSDERGEHEPGLVIHPVGATMREFVATLDHGEFDHAEHMASWGYCDCVEYAAPDDTDVAIWHLYESGFDLGGGRHPRGACYVHHMVGGQSKLLILPTVTDAKAWIAEQVAAAGSSNSVWHYDTVAYEIIRAPQQ